MNAAEKSLAINGGVPVRDRLLPYGRHLVTEQDMQAVLDVLRSDWLTTGPTVGAFEDAVAQTVRAKYVAVLSSGTAALHAAVFAAGVGPGDEVIVPPLTFAASANAVLYQGADVVFADVDPGTLNLDPEAVEAALSARTRAILAVDYAGQPADLDELKRIARRHDLCLIEDASHALGATYRGVPVGCVSDLTTFSYHPVKHVAAGEGGSVATDNEEYDRRIRGFRNHGITTDHHQRRTYVSHCYEMEELGYNYRLSDIHCALGLSQLGRLDENLARRQEIAAEYGDAFQQIEAVRPLAEAEDRSSAWHLYVVRLRPGLLRADRDTIFRALRAENIGVNVHYPLVHLHPYYRRNLGTREGMCPVAEAAYKEILTLPMFPAMSDQDVVDVVAAMDKITSAFQVEE